MKFSIAVEAKFDDVDRRRTAKPSVVWTVVFGVIVVLLTTKVVAV